MAWWDAIPVIGPLVRGAMGDSDAPKYQGYNVRQGAFGNLMSQRQWQPFLWQGMQQLWGTPRATGEIDTAQQAEWRKRQQEAADLLRAQATGQAASAAEMQMRAGLDTARRQVGGMAAQAGVSPALAQRQAMAAQSQLSQQGIAQTAAMRAAEQARAQQAYAGMIGGARAQDIGLAQSQAQLALQAQALRDRLVSAFTGMGLSAAEADRQAQIMYEQMMQQDAQARAGLAQQAWQTGSQNAMTYQGAMMSGLGSLLGGLL